MGGEITPWGDIFMVTASGWKVFSRQMVTHFTDELAAISSSEGREGNGNDKGNGHLAIVSIQMIIWQRIKSQSSEI